MKTAFVTGGSGGIGSAVCKRLSTDGYAVAVGYNSSKAAACDCAEYIREHGGTAFAVKCDVADSASILAAREEILRELSAPSALVCCSGEADISLFTDQTNDRIRQLIDTDLLGVMLTVKAFIPDMIKAHTGSVVLMSSVWGEQGASCETVYSAAKSGIIGFTKALGKELAPSRVRVNCISPGFIDTKMNGGLTDEERSAFINEIPMLRAGLPDEVAAAVSFLISEGASYITAQDIGVNGGL